MVRTSTERSPSKRGKRLAASSAVRLVVSCTKRKKQEPASLLTLDSINSDSLTRRAQTWLHRLREHDQEEFVARDLYAGDHWSVVQAIGRDQAVETWVASAGLGLISADAKIPSYSATFSTGEIDAIVGPNDPNSVALKKAWWAALSEWTGPTPGAPRSLSALARQRPSVPLMCVAAPTYLEAMLDDLLAARRALASPDLLVIVSAGGLDSFDDLAQHLVPCDARLQQVLGGALSALNVRVARRILEERAEHPVRAAALKARWTSLLGSITKPAPLSREPMSDHEVRAFITQSLKRDPALRPTRLLRELRDSGRACEHHRFRDLFNSVAEEVFHGA